MKFILVFLILIPTVLFSQNIVVKGRVLNKEDSAPIPGVHISIDSVSNLKAVANSEGKFSFKFRFRNEQIIVLSHSVFDDRTIELKNYSLKRIQNDTLDLGDITLVFGDKIFKVVEVSSEKVPETIFGSEKFSVEDFELIDDRILMLVYEKTLKRASEILLTDKNQHIISSVFVPGQAKELMHDFRGEIYLKTEEAVFHVKVNQNDIIQLTPLDYGKFLRQIEPVKDSLYEDLYFSDYSEIFPKFSYFEFDREDSIYTTVKGIVDQVMMDMYRAEFKYVDVRTKLWAHNLQNETGIDKEDIVGATIFTQSIYYEPLFAPMFVKYDTVYVFDHYKNQLYTFISDRGIIDSIGIYYHLKPKTSGWKNAMVQDLQNDEIYGLFNRHGFSYLKPINVHTGFTDGVFKLYYRYVEKVIVKDNYVYYTYRPFESIQKKYIYREKIPNEVLEKQNPIELITEE